MPEGAIFLAHGHACLANKRFYNDPYQLILYLDTHKVTEKR